jgi:histidinol-phosphate aminotransferase
MGLLDYYRQFEDVDEEEWNRGLRERRARERAQALERVPTIDLSGTEWPDLPNSEVVNAAIARARGRVNGYPDRRADGIRALLAERHGVAPEQIVVGNGAAELLQTAASVMLGAGDELVTAWPSYPLYPLMASRAGARPVPVDLAGGRADPAALLAAVSERTRAVVLCNPNDPTGTYLPAAEVRALADALPAGVPLLVDEAFVQFQDVEAEDSVLRLVDDHDNVLVFRTFSKIYGLSGLRAGYAVGSASAGALLEALGPALGVNALTQAAVEQALRIGDAEVGRRRQLVIEQRGRIVAALHDLPADAPESQANFVWLHAAGLSGPELAARLQKGGVIVATGTPLGEDDHVRASIRTGAATDRLLKALTEALGAEPRHPTPDTRDPTAQS